MACFPRNTLIPRNYVPKRRNWPGRELYQSCAQQCGQPLVIGWRIPKNTLRAAERRRCSLATRLSGLSEKQTVHDRHKEYMCLWSGKGESSEWVFFNYLLIGLQVHITGMTFARQGVAIKVSFSTTRACKNIVWEYSSRLISGSMVALSPARDCFKSQCVIAIVAARPLDQLKQYPPQVDLFFANPDEAHFDPQQEWIMVQPHSGYLESVRHTMRTLQLMKTEW